MTSEYTFGEEVTPITNPQFFNFATDVVDQWAAKSPSLKALIWTSGKDASAQEFTYSHFSKRSQQAAIGLQKLGAKRGDRMIILLSRVPAWWEIATAAIRMGLVLCPCTTLAVAKDIEFRAQASGASIFVGNDVAVKSFLQVKPQCPKVRIVMQAAGDVVQGQDIVQYHDMMGKIDPQLSFKGPKTRSEEPALIYFTSGTTGMPKMVVHNQVSYPLAHSMTGKNWLNLDTTKVYWNMSEQGWAKAAWAWFSAWNRGAALFVEDLSGPFSHIRMLETLHRHPVTTLCAPPTIYRQLVLADAQQYLAKNKPRALEHCVGAGEPLNAEVIRQWQEMTGLSIRDGYGQTETVLSCGNFVGQEVRPGSMGRPTPGLPLDIIDADGHVAKAGEEGDIAIATTTQSGDKVTCIMDGYLKPDGSTYLGTRDQKDKARQWYLTGDRGYRDEAGYFWFVGRSDDVITSAGYRIGPFEVESVLKRHPAVQESAAVASPDKARGEVVKAFIVLTAEYKTKDQNALIKEIQAFCKENAAPYKYPRKIQFVDDSFLPKTISGKIRRVELRQMEYSGKATAKL